MREMIYSANCVLCYKFMFHVCGWTLSNHYATFLSLIFFTEEMSNRNNDREQIQRISTFQIEYALRLMYFNRLQIAIEPGDTGKST